MTVSFVLDGLIAVLLVTTIVWCVVLNRRLAGLRRNQTEFASLISGLNEATERAEVGIAALKSNAEQAGASLQSSITQAERLNNDLNFLAERGARLAQRLEKTGVGERASPPASSEGGANQARQRLEEELLTALRKAR